MAWLISEDGRVPAALLLSALLTISLGLCVYRWKSSRSTGNAQQQAHSGGDVSNTTAKHAVTLQVEEQTVDAVKTVDCSTAEAQQPGQPVLPLQPTPSGAQRPVPQPSASPLREASPGVKAARSVSVCIGGDDSVAAAASAAITVQLPVPVPEPGSGGSGSGDAGRAPKLAQQPHCPKAAPSLQDELGDVRIWDAYQSALQVIPVPPTAVSAFTVDVSDGAAAGPEVSNLRVAALDATEQLMGGRRAIGPADGMPPTAGPSEHPQQQRLPMAGSGGAASASSATQEAVESVRVPPNLSLPGPDGLHTPNRCLLRDAAAGAAEPVHLPIGSPVYRSRARERELLLGGAGVGAGGHAGGWGGAAPTAAGTTAAALCRVDGGVRDGMERKDPVAHGGAGAGVGAGAGSIVPPPALLAGWVDNQNAAALGLEVSHLNIDPALVTIKREIGRGGFGRVYAGTYQGTPVAIKMLLGANSSSLEVAALRLEVSILSRAKHPNIVRIYGCNLDDTQPFIVEELLSCTLHDYIYHPLANTRPLLLVRLARDIASALSYLHPSVLHRDLKPGNVLLDKQGNPKLADFGLARWKLRTLLSTRTVEAGSVPYLAPECFDPDNWRLSDRIDIYSLGVLLNEMMMRSPPWKGLGPMEMATEVLMMGHRPAMPAPGSPFPEALLRLVRSCWAQQPSARPSAAAVHQELLEIYEQLKAADRKEAGAARGT